MTERTEDNALTSGESKPAFCAGGGLGNRVIVFFVLCYRVTLGHFMGGHCRFQPSCSQYMIEAVERHGFFRGVWRGVKRILRCHPFGGSGHDPA